MNFMVYYLKMSISITNYYVPWVGDDFFITKTNITLKGRPKMFGSHHDESLRSIMPVGIADSSRQNRCYETLLANLEINKMDNSEIVELLKEKLLIASSDYDHSSYSLREKEIAFPIEKENMLRIIKLRLYEGWSTKSLWSRFGVTNQQLTQLFRMV